MQHSHFSSQGNLDHSRRQSPNSPDQHSTGCQTNRKGEASMQQPIFTGLPRSAIRTYTTMKRLQGFRRGRRAREAVAQARNRSCDTPIAWVLQEKQRARCGQCSRGTVPGAPDAAVDWSEALWHLLRTSTGRREQAVRGNLHQRPCPPVGASIQRAPEAIPACNFTRPPLAPRPPRCVMSS